MNFGFGVLFLWGFVFKTLYYVIGFRGGFVNNWQGTPDNIDDLRRRKLSRTTISVSGGGE